MTSNTFDLGGVIVATTLAFKEDASAPAGLAVDYDRFAEHCDWLIAKRMSRGWSQRVAGRVLVADR